MKENNIFEPYMNAHFGYALFLQRTANILKVLILLLNIFLIFSPRLVEKFENDVIGHFILLFNYMFLFSLDYFLIEKSRKEHEKAEKIRTACDAQRFFDFKISPKVYNLKRITSIWVSWQVKKSTKKENYSENSKSDKNKEIPIIRKIQESCHSTWFYLKKYHQNILLQSYLGLFLLIIAIAIYVYSSTDTFTSIQVVIALTSVIFSMNIHFYIKRIGEKCDLLEELEEILHNLKDVENPNNIAYFFSRYNSIIVDKPSWPGTIRTKYFEKVKKEWEEKLSGYEEVCKTISNSKINP